VAGGRRQEAGSRFGETCYFPPAVGLRPLLSGKIFTRRLLFKSSIFMQHILLVVNISQHKSNSYLSMR